MWLILGGSFTATYEVAVSNTGNEPVGVVLTDDLAAGFPAGFSVESVVGSGDVSANVSFDGSLVTRLNGADVLPVGGSGLLTYEVMFVPSSSAAIGNTVAVVATGTVGGSVVNKSTELVASSDIPFVSSLGAAKELLALDDNGDGTFTAHFRFVVENLGNEPVSGIQLADDLSSFGIPTIAIVASSGLTPNAGFNGGTDQDILVGTDLLSVGVTGSIDIDVTYVPASASAQLNQAVVTGTGSTTGATLTDDSDAGSDPDGNGDGDPASPGEDDATPVLPPLDASAGVAKDLVGVANNGNGSFTATYLITIENFGNEALESVVVRDDLSAFPATPVVTVRSSLDVNPAYNGTTDTALTTGIDALAVGATATVELDVTFIPDSLAPIGNSAVVEAVGTASGVSTADTSTPGSDPDPDGNGEPTESAVTLLDPLTLGIQPVVGVAKSNGPVSDEGAGWFSIDYTLFVENFGTESIDGLQLTDNLAAFPAGFTVATASSDGLTVNPGYDGVGDTNVLDGSDSLAVGVTRSVVITVQFKPGSPVSIGNDAVGAGIGAVTGLTTSDNSVNGANADPNGDDSPAESSTTGITGADLPLDAVIGASKALTGVVSNGDGSFDATYQFHIENYGNETLVNVGLADDLSAFPAGWLATVTSADLTPNPGFNGSSDIELLAGIDLLEPGQSGVVTLVVTFVPTGPIGVIENRSTASGIGVVQGTTVSDASAYGGDPDPNGDGNPDESGATLLTGSDLPVGGGLGLAKTLAGVIDNDDGSFVAQFMVEIENLGNESITDLQIIDDISLSFPAGSTSVATLLTGTLTLNPGYDGSSDTVLLAGVDVLPVDAVASIQIDVAFTPTSSATITNTATADGSGQISLVLQGESATAELTSGDIPFDSSLGLTKSLVGVVDDGGGYFVATYDIVVANLGNESLVSVVVSDDIAPTFPAGSVGTVVSTTGTLTANAAFDGQSDTALLAGSDQLAVGQTESIKVSVRFRPTSLDPIGNTASTAATGGISGSLASVTSDVSTLGAGDIPLVSRVGSAKELLEVVDNGDGSFDAVYQIIIENFGNEALVGVQVADTLDVAFGPGVTTFVDVLDGVGSASTTFNGATDVDLLASPIKLDPGQSTTIGLTINFTPLGTASIGNSVIAVGSGELTGTLTNDLSADGATPDPNGDGDPVESSVTTLSADDLPLRSTLSLTKSAATIVDLGGGQFSATFVIGIKNSGNEPATSVQIVDDIADHFPAEATVATVGSDGLTVNPAYDGFVTTNLLSGTDVLAVGASATVTLKVEYEAESAAVKNKITGSSVGGLTGDVATRLAAAPSRELPLTSSIGGAKALVAGPILHDDGTVTATYEIRIENFGNQPLVEVQVVDDLGVGLGQIRSASVASVEGLTANPNFDGVTDLKLLDGSDTLAISGRGAVRITATFVPVGEFMTNIAVVHAKGIFLAGVTSDNTIGGSDPDPDGDGVPGEEGTTSTKTPGLFIAGKVWQDDNNNGIRNDGEVPLAGITVILRPLPTYVGDGGINNSGLVVLGDDGLRTAITDADGNYYFGALPPGYYRVEVRPDGRELSRRANAGNDDSVDSDFDTKTKKTAVLTVREAQQPSLYVTDISRVDAGLSRKSAVAGAGATNTAGNGASSGGTPGNASVLAYTGSSTVGMLLISFGLLLLGSVLVGGTRRREEDLAD